MIGDRFFGWRGAFAALAGMITAPLALVLTLAVLYAELGTHPTVTRMLGGMGAVSAGLVMAMAIKLARSQRGGALGWLLVAAAFVMVGVLRWPMLTVLLGLGSVSIGLAYRRGAK